MAQFVNGQVKARRGLSAALCFGFWPCLRVNGGRIISEQSHSNNCFKKIPVVFGLQVCHVVEGIVVRYLVSDGLSDHE